MSIVIESNYQPRDLVCWYDLEPKDQADFDYIEEEDRGSLRLFEYRNSWYDINEFMAISHRDPDKQFRKWQGVMSDTVWSGVVVKYAGDDFDKVIVGRFYQ